MAKRKANLIRISKHRLFRGPDSALGEAVIVRTGLLAIYTPSPTGGKTITALRFPNEVIMPQAKSVGYGVQALVKSEVELSEDRPDFDLLRFERIAHEWIARLGLKAMERVAHLICELVVRGDYPRDALPKLLTQQQMAEITAQTSVNVNRVLSELQQMGLLSRPLHSEGRFLLPDWEGLARLGCFNEGAFA